jgi:hypothetical protein
MTIPVVALAAVLAVPLLPLAADADPLLTIVNYGALGMMLVLFVIGRVHSDAEVKDLKRQNDKLTDALMQVQASLTRQTLPALTRSAQVLEAIPESEASLVAELQQALTRLEGLERKQSEGS